MSDPIQASCSILNLQNQNQRLYNALAKMYLWQASDMNCLLPDGLAKEVRALLGEKMVDAIIYSEHDATFEEIQRAANSTSEVQSL